MKFDPMPWRAPQSRSEYLTEKDSDREYWKDLERQRNINRRPGFGKLANMKYNKGD